MYVPYITNYIPCAKRFCHNCHNYEISHHVAFPAMYKHASLDYAYFPRFRFGLHKLLPRGFSFYIRTSIARTPVARLSWLIRTRI